MSYSTFLLILHFGHASIDPCYFGGDATVVALVLLVALCFSRVVFVSSVDALCLAAGLGDSGNWVFEPQAGVVAV